METIIILLWVTWLNLLFLYSSGQTKKGGWKGKRTIELKLCPWLFIAQLGENSHQKGLQPYSAISFRMSAIDHLWQVFNSLSHQGQCATFCWKWGVSFHFKAANNCCLISLAVGSLSISYSQLLPLKQWKLFPLFWSPS